MQSPRLLDDKYSDPLCRRLLSVAFFLDPRFLADYLYVPSDVGMSSVNSLVVGYVCKLQE